MAKTAKKAAKTKAAKTTEKGAVKRSPRLGDDGVIRLTTQDNPRRPGTDAHSHFEKMKGGVTVAAYLKKFKVDDRKVARQWLTNTIRDGHAKVLGA